MRQPSNLLKAAIFTRIGIGVVRILETYPTQGHNPRMNWVDKWRAFWERTFIEVVGVASQVLLLYAPLEAVGGLLESKLLGKALGKIAAQLPKNQQQAVNSLLQGAFNPYHAPYPKGIVAERLFKSQTFKEAATRVTDEIAKLLAGSPRKNQVLAELLQFQKKVTFSAAGSLLLGVLSSAFLSGFALQWVNDNLFSPKVVPWLLRITGVTPPVAQPLSPVPLPPAAMAAELPPLSQRTFRM
jgi:hypothetical protein